MATNISAINASGKPITNSGSTKVIDFSKRNSGGVVIGPDASGVTRTDNPVYLNVSPGSASAANQVQTINSNPVSSVSGMDIASSLDALTKAVGASSLDYNKLQNLIMQNTDKNNAWSAKQAQNQMAFQERMQGIAQDFNASEAAKNRNWQEMMSNTAHQREVADLKAAGLNPVLSASGGNGASMGSGSAASVGMQSGAQGNPDQSGNSALVSLYSALINAQTQMQNADLSAKTNLKMAEMSKEAQMYGSALAAQASIENAQMAAQASMANAETSADAARYAAGTNYAASQYAADMNYKNNEAQREWNAAHPSNAYQAGASILGNVNKGTPTGKSLFSGSSGVHVFDDFVNGVKSLFK